VERSSETLTAMPPNGDTAWRAGPSGALTANCRLSVWIFSSPGGCLMRYVELRGR
jgi:hypothetical protein